METKLEYMKRVCNELDVALTDVTTKALHVADELGINKGLDMGPAEVIITLRHQIQVGEAYNKPFEPSPRPKKKVFGPEFDEQP